MSAITTPSQRPGLKVGILALAILLVMVLACRQIYRLSATPMWVAAANLAPGTRLGPQHLEVVYERTKTLPPGALLDKAALEGKLLYPAKAAGSPFFAADFTPPPSAPPTPIAAIIPAGRVLVTVKMTQVSVPYTQLRGGDRLEVIAAGGRGETPTAHVVARDAYLIGTMAPASAAPSPAKKDLLGVDLTPPTRQKKGGEGSVSLILALHPRDVLPVATAQAREASLAFVLHGHTEVKSGELLQLPGARAVELIAGGHREQVSF